MATADEYATWIVNNQDKRGTKEFDIVAQAYQNSKAAQSKFRATEPEGMPGPRAQPPAWAAEYPGLYKAAVTTRQMVGPTVEMLGGVVGGAGGATAGTFGAGPFGTAVGGITGSALGYGAAKQGLRAVDVALGLQPPSQTLGQEARQAAGNVVEGATYEDARAVLREMLGRLKQTHFAIFPGGLYADLESAVGGEGWPGFEVQVIDGHALVSGGSVIPWGWEVVSAGGTNLPDLIAKLRQDPAIHELQLQRAVAARLSGPVGTARQITFADAKGERVQRDIRLLPPRGELSGFGNLPPQRVWIESNKLGETGYIRFNMFLDLLRVMQDRKSTRLNSSHT